MAAVAFIPARGGSQSIPLKNIRSFCGKPLIYWNLMALQSSPFIDRIVVSTDSDAIEQVVQGFGFSKVELFRRSSSSASSTASSEMAMLDFINSPASQLKGDDLFLLVQATSPFTREYDFSKALQLFEKNKFDSLLTCVRIKRFFWSPDGRSLNYDYMHRPRRQDFDGELMENGAFYISKVRSILETGNRLSGNIGIYEMPEYMGVEIDEEDDWHIAENLMLRHQNIVDKRDYRKVKLFLTDVDGVLTDAGMYYSENGDELKKFNTRDGMGLRLIKSKGIKTGIITSEDTMMVERRFKKLELDYLYQGKKYGGKLAAALDICEKEGIDISQVAYIGDDVNCHELLSKVGFPACPCDADNKILSIPNILVLSKQGGKGVVREYVEEIIRQ